MIKLQNGELHAIVPVDAIIDQINTGDIDVFKQQSYYQEEINKLQQYLEQAQVYRSDSKIKIILPQEIDVIQYSDISGLHNYLFDYGTTASYLVSHTIMCELIDEAFNNPEDLDWRDGNEVWIWNE